MSDPVCGTGNPYVSCCSSERTTETPMWSCRCELDGSKDLNFAYPEYGSLIINANKGSGRSLAVTLRKDGTTWMGDKEVILADAKEARKQDNRRSWVLKVALGVAGAFALLYIARKVVKRFKAKKKPPPKGPDDFPDGGTPSGSGAADPAKVARILRLVQAKLEKEEGVGDDRGEEPIGDPDGDADPSTNELVITDTPWNVQTVHGGGMLANIGRALAGMESAVERALKGVQQVFTPQPTLAPARVPPQTPYSFNRPHRFAPHWRRPTFALNRL